MSVFNTQNGLNNGSYFTKKDLRTLWANEYIEESSRTNTDHAKNMEEIRAQQQIGVDERSINAKNVSTVAGVAIATGIILKEYGGVVASKALPMVSKFL